MKVIYHINEIDKYSSLNSNTKNTLAYDATIDVVVVANVLPFLYLQTKTCH